MKFDKDLLGTTIKYPVKGGYKLETVVDIFVTHNLGGQVVDVQYQTEHDFLGQTITALRPHTSIIRYMVK